ncbi:MAG: nucleoid-associated protein [Phocaeicola sp.]
MYNTEKTSITHIVLHAVGNKKNEEPISLSPHELQVKDSIKSLLILYFTSSFRSNEHFYLSHETDISMNEVYRYVSEIFSSPTLLHKQSINLAKHLYEQSNHPKIKGGEFYVVYFKDCEVEGETVDAIGLFKSENKETFLKVYPSGDGFEIESQQGVNINKLDKGCLIFNKEGEAGYVVAVVDNTNKGMEAQYWIDDFLHVRKRKDEYYYTENLISLTKNFVTKELAKEVELSKTEQADLLNKSAKFLRGRETFDMEEFANEVIARPEVRERFNQYKENYQRERNLEIADSFAISDKAVKKKAQGMKSIIKLDKNFQIHINGGESQYITKGYDTERGMHYYQLFFEKEE